jgi:translation elongation factor EF-4
VSINGIEDLSIGCTIADVDSRDALPMLGVDEPTLTMNFQVNKSPFAGQEGKYVTSRQLRERLDRELLSNVALRVEETPDADVFLVSGRGELHLTILIENMRREGYELAVGKPRVVTKDVGGVKHEPWELLTIDVEQENQGKLMEELGRRGGALQDMMPDGKGRVRLDYRIPVARPHRLPHGIHDAHARHGHQEPRVRGLCAGEGRDSLAPERRPRVDGAGRSRRLRALEPGGARTHVRLPGRARLRGHDRRHS